MSSFCAVIAGVCIFLFPVTLVMFIIRAIMGKKLKPWTISMACVVGFFVLSVIVGVATDCKHEYVVLEKVIATCEEDGFVLSRCILCDREKRQIDTAEGHMLQEMSQGHDGSLYSVCSICGYEVVSSVLDDTDVDTSQAALDKEEKTEEYAEETIEEHVHSYTHTIVEEATLLKVGIEK